MKKSQKGKKFEFKDAIKDFFDFKYLYFSFYSITYKTKVCKEKYLIRHVFKYQK